MRRLMHFDAERQDISAQVHHSDVSGQSGSIARAARSTGHESSLIQNESEIQFMSIVEGDDGDLIGIENSQLEQSPTSPSL